MGQFDQDGAFKAQPRLLEALEQRETAHVTRSLAQELGLPHYTPREGEQVSGTFTKSVNLASGRYAVIQKAQEFTLVPWRPDMEQLRGKAVTGTATAQGIQWESGLRRGLGI